ncbi:MAG: heavy metal translocating P-type ATPase [bacterium]|nr:heavy metal translocating P-type ATPase [bacterium]
MKQKFDVTGMTCSACSSRVEKTVAKLNGTNQVQVNLLTNSMQVEYDDQIINEDDIIHAVVGAGYGASIQEETITGNNHTRKEERKDVVGEQLANMKMRLYVSFVFLIPLMYVSMGHMVGAPLPGFLTGHSNMVSFAFTQFLLCLPIVYVNRQYFIKGFNTLFHLAPNMDSLIAIGSLASLVYGVFAIYRMSYGIGAGRMDIVETYHMDLYFESAAMILALITLGKFLETRSKGKTSEAITKLMDLAPKTAVVERDGKQVEIPANEVVKGDIVIVKPGQSVPVDGVIIEGTTSIDEAAITGESIPVEKEKGSNVIAATINKAGFIRVEATKVGDDTTFSQIIRLVEEASSSKAPIAKMADKIAGIFVPVVITIALVAGAVWLLSGATFEFALSIAISVLVISCPCALGLATPVAIMVGTGKGAEHGILIKSGEALETAHSIDSVVLDKTGTITEGKPQVTDVYCLGNMDENKLITIAASLEAKSEHPLAEAIMSYAKERNDTEVNVEDFFTITGKGLSGKIDGTLYYAGNERLMEEKKISTAHVKEQLDHYAMEGKTPLLFANEKEIIGVIAVADIVKATSKQAIEELKALGIKVIMLTGDNKKTAEAIRSQLDIDTVIAEVLPQEKEQEIVKLQNEGKKVAMVGDGVNDAPALARADVGLAIGAGTDVAIESADIVLMKNDLLDAVTAIRLSKAVIRNIKENLFWAFFYNSVGIPLAAGLLYPFFGLKLNPMFGAAAMSLSSVCVVSNALRLRLFKSDYHRNELTNVNSASIEPMQEVNQQQPIKEEQEMIKVSIEGMMCGHCTGTVEKVLKGIAGDQVEVSLEDKAAYIKESDVSDEVITKAITDAGYEVISITR